MMPGDRRKWFAFITDRRGRTIRIGWFSMSIVMMLWKIVLGDDGIPALPVEGKSAETIILGLYVYFVAQDLKRSLRVVVEKVEGKQDKATCEQRHGKGGPDE